MDYRTIETDAGSIEYTVNELLRKYDGSVVTVDSRIQFAVDMIMSLAAELEKVRAAANNNAPAGLISVTWLCAECGRSWTQAITPGFLPRYCPGDDGAMSACAITAKKRHDKATGAERVKRFRDKRANAKQSS